MSTSTSRTHGNPIHHHHHHHSQNHAPSRSSGGEVGPPQASLESTGISFGDVSMASASKQKLENTGTSFGSMMSYNTMKVDMVDGGLDNIGTSFGSLSLDTTNRDTLFQQLEMAAAGPEIPPMFQAQRSTANLLECSDTESEGEEEPELVAQKSAMWEKMQASLAAQTQASQNSEEEMPPPAPLPFKGGTTNSTSSYEGMSVPVTHMERDFSALSGMEGDFDHDEAAAVVPPPAMAKQDSEGQKLEMFYFGNGNAQRL